MMRGANPVGRAYLKMGHFCHHDVVESCGSCRSTSQGTMFQTQKTGRYDTRIKAAEKATKSAQHGTRLFIDIGCRHTILYATAHWTCMIVVKKRTHAKRAREHLTQDAVPIPMS